SKRSAGISYTVYFTGFRKPEDLCRLRSSGKLLQFEKEILIWTKQTYRKRESWSESVWVSWLLTSIARPFRLAHFSMQEYLQNRLEIFEAKSLSPGKDVIMKTCPTILLFDEFSKGYCDSDSEFLQR